MSDAYERAQLRSINRKNATNEPLLAKENDFLDKRGKDIHALFPEPLTKKQASELINPFTEQDKRAVSLYARMLVEILQRIIQEGHHKDKEIIYEYPAGEFQGSLENPYMKVHGYDGIIMQLRGTLTKDGEGHIVIFAVPTFGKSNGPFGRYEGKRPNEERLKEDARYRELWEKMPKKLTQQSIHVATVTLKQGGAIEFNGMPFLDEELVKHGPMQKSIFSADWAI